MKSINFVFLCTCVALLTSCANFKDYWLTDHGTYHHNLTQYEETLEIWKGADINRLINKWGPPTSTFTMPNGHVMYSWYRTGGTVASATYFPAINSSFSSASTATCKTTFTTTDDIVISWIHEGNACE